jgi:hypothetical protein
MVEAEIYTTDDGFVAIEQPNDKVVLLSVDQMLSAIGELQVVLRRPRRVTRPARA